MSLLVVILVSSIVSLSDSGCKSARLSLDQCLDPAVAPNLLYAQQSKEQLDRPECEARPARPLVARASPTVVLSRLIGRALRRVSLWVPCSDL